MVNYTGSHSGEEINPCRVGLGGHFRSEHGAILQFFFEQETTDNVAVIRIVEMLGLEMCVASYGGKGVKWAVWMGAFLLRGCFCLLVGYEKPVVGRCGVFI